MQQIPVILHWGLIPLQLDEEWLDRQLRVSRSVDDGLGTIARRSRGPSHGTNAGTQDDSNYTRNRWKDAYLRQPFRNRIRITSSRSIVSSVVPTRSCTPARSYIERYPISCPQRGSCMFESQGSTAAENVSWPAARGILCDGSACP